MRIKRTTFLSPICGGSRTSCTRACKWGPEVGRRAWKAPDWAVWFSELCVRTSDNVYARLVYFVMLIFWFAGCRGCAYEAVGLFAERLPREDFREGPQLEALLQTLRRSIAVPFQRLSSIVALFLAESALQLQHPGGAMYPLLNKLLLMRPTLNFEVLIAL